MRRLVHSPGIIFALFALWKITLFSITVQPIPANDAYFYDGAVVNRLHGGTFVNPTVAIARPYSGTEFFSAYPPLYQPVLYLWMSICGASAASAAGLHVLLVIIWSGLVYRILRRLEIATWAMHLAGGFLFVVTFHDRPDTLAHVLGTGAVLAVVHWLNPVARPVALWMSAILLALTYATSLQLGAMYTGLVGVTVCGYCWFSKAKLPWTPLLVMALIPFGLLVLGKYTVPRWWLGFVENAQDNPSTLGLHVPDVGALLKLARTLPGVLLLPLLLIANGSRIRAGLRDLPKPTLAIFLGATFATLAVMVLSLCYLTPNYLTTFAAFLQPIVIGAGLATVTPAGISTTQRAIVVGLGCAAIGLGGIRAVGMTTWGLLCASDVSYRDSRDRVNTELDAIANADSRPVALSAAYLYAASGHTNLSLIHVDYMVRLKGAATASDLDGLLELKPGRLLLTQFDYYRRYEHMISLLRREPAVAEVRVENCARVPAPDAIPSMRKVVQHISWAPVIVKISWRENAGN